MCRYFLISTVVPVPLVILFKFFFFFVKFFFSYFFCPKSPNDLPNKTLSQSCEENVFFFKVGVNNCTIKKGGMVTNDVLERFFFQQKQNK